MTSEDEKQSRAEMQGQNKSPEKCWESVTLSSQEILTVTKSDFHQPRIFKYPLRLMCPIKK